MFELFNIEGLQVCHPGPISLYANGRISGVVCDSGHGITQSIVVYEGFSMKHTSKINIHNCGGKITEYLNRILENVGIRSDLHHTESSSWNQIVRKMKEQKCYVRND